jgi:hypothetical protein
MVTSKIRRVEYFHATVRDRPGEAYRLLSKLASSGVNLLAFSAIPAGPDNTQLMLFPESPEHLVRAAGITGLVLTGPQHAFLIQGDDELGAFADIHHKLYDSQVNVYASTGVADGRGGYGYVIYVKGEDYEDAARALKV